MNEVWIIWTLRGQQNCRGVKERWSEVCKVFEVPTLCLHCWVRQLGKSHTFQDVLLSMMFTVQLSIERLCNINTIFINVCYCAVIWSAFLATANTWLTTLWTAQFCPAAWFLPSGWGEGRDLFRHREKVARKCSKVGIELRHSMGRLSMVSLGVEHLNGRDSGNVDSVLQQVLTQWILNGQLVEMASEALKGSKESGRWK